MFMEFIVYLLFFETIALGTLISYGLYYMVKGRYQPKIQYTHKRLENPYINLDFSDIDTIYKK